MGKLIFMLIFYLCLINTSKAQVLSVTATYPPYTDFITGTYTNNQPDEACAEWHFISTSNNYWRWVVEIKKNGNLIYSGGFYSNEINFKVGAQSRRCHHYQYKT